MTNIGDFIGNRALRKEKLSDRGMRERIEESEFIERFSDRFDECVEEHVGRNERIDVNHRSQDHLRAHKVVFDGEGNGSHSSPLKIGLE